MRALNDDGESSGPAESLIGYMVVAHGRYIIGGSVYAVSDL